MDPRASLAGVAFGLGAYGIWGFFPLFFRQLGHVSPVDLLCNRAAWGCLFVSLILTARHHWAATLAAARRPGTVLRLGVAALLVGSNWLAFLWAVDQRQVVASSLGYFLTPLVNVLLGMLVLKERLNGKEWASVGLAVAAVGSEFLTLGSLPWISIFIGVSFGITFAIAMVTGPLITQAVGLSGLFWLIALLAMALQKRGLGAKSMTGAQVAIRTDSAFTKARIEAIDDSNMRAELAKRNVIIVADFQGIDSQGNITTTQNPLDMAINGADFVQVFRFFIDAGQSPEDSFASSQRVFRGAPMGGGAAFTKDTVYLHGLLSVHTFFRWCLRHRKLAVARQLFAGKLALEDVFALQPMFDAGVIAAPVYLPPWMQRANGLAGMLAFSLFANKIRLDRVDADVVFHLRGQRHHLRA